MQHISKMMFTTTAKALESIIGSSFFINPYQTQRDNPEISTRIIVHERSSAFFSFNTFTSCGIIDMDVRIPAIIPRIFSFITYLLFRIRNFCAAMLRLQLLWEKSFKSNFVMKRNSVFNKII